MDKTALWLDFAQKDDYIIPPPYCILQIVNYVCDRLKVCICMLNKFDLAACLLHAFLQYHSVGCVFLLCSCLPTDRSSICPGPNHNAFSCQCLILFFHNSNCCNRVFFSWRWGNILSFCMAYVFHMY